MTRALAALLTQAIDYAGVFPPAKLDLAAAHQEYIRYRKGPESWILGKFAVRSTQLAEFTGLLQGQEKLADPIPITVIGSSGTDSRIVDFYNCNIYQNDSNALTYSGGGASLCSTVMKNCYIKGYTYINGSTAARPDFSLKATDCFFEAIPLNYNGKVNILDIGEYYGDPALCRVIFERCSFKSDNHAIEVGLGYGALGTNKKLILCDCKFMTGSSGWIINNHPAYEFKLLNNYANNPATGTVPVVNALAETGISIEPALEVFAP